MEELNFQMINKKLIFQQMIKLEEDISLMEEQSVSDLDDTQQEDYTTSQVVKGFLRTIEKCLPFQLICFRNLKVLLAINIIPLREAPPRLALLE
jgi:hypothetical protein